MLAKSGKILIAHHKAQAAGPVLKVIEALLLEVIWQGQIVVGAEQVLGHQSLVQV